MHQAYHRSILLIERLHRYFLEVVKAELDRRSIQDINNIQALILYNIGRDDLTVGELTARGYYLGSNVSYNVKKMVENSYLAQEKSKHDRRSVRIRLTDKGIELHDVLDEMFDRHVAQLPDAQIDEPGLNDLIERLTRLEQFWISRVNFPVGPGRI